MKVIYLNCGWRRESERDPRTNEHYFSVYFIATGFLDQKQERWRENVWNVSFRISRRRLTHVINSVDTTSLSCNTRNRRSTTVSVETDALPPPAPLFKLCLFGYVDHTWNSSLIVDKADKDAKTQETWYNTQNDHWNGLSAFYNHKQNSKNVKRKDTREQQVDKCKLA